MKQIKTLFLNLSTLVFLVCISSLLAKAQTAKGFFDYTIAEDDNKILLHIPVSRLGEEFLYINSLAAGIGSNDIGLDRGQLGNERIVKFIKSGDQILLVQPNYTYRAISDNIAEVKAVKDAFAESILWGGTVQSKDGDVIITDISSLIIQDAHGIADRLKSKKQGQYKLDAKRSTLWRDNTKNFPKNTEFEAVITFTGKAEGAYIKSVTPTADVITVRVHHSMVELPDNAYQPRAFHPSSGYFYASHYDYAAPISDDLMQRYITRHRLVKKDPNALLSEPVEPIIYYLDAGTPEPVRSALLDGARWWNQAFEAAGFKDAFQVEMLPDHADPMDVRYNVIQWVHRSTRGWSYGASVVDPRTGEIIKGHVSLGSLRVRQDYLIAQGLLSPYGSDTDVNLMEDMALARLRQLSAHEIGHTIGLAHNYAASVDNRSSVMDYPHPNIQIDAEGKLDFSDAYDDKIGVWDKRAILYGYGSMGNMSEDVFLSTVIKENKELGLNFITDQDARPMGSSNAVAHLWDQGTDIIAELDRMVQVRKVAMMQFGENSISNGRPFSELEKVFAPLYYMHRYQVEAVSKMIAGEHYDYAIKGESTNKVIVKAVDAEQQKNALASILEAISPDNLNIPEHILNLIPPQAYGYSRDRESIGSYSNDSFDPSYAALSFYDFALSMLMHPDRLSRMSNQGIWSLKDYFYQLKTKTITIDIDLKSRISKSESYLYKLLELANNQSTNPNVRVQAYREARQFVKSTANVWIKEYLQKLMDDVAQDPEKVHIYKESEMPPGSPIGCGHFHGF